MVEPRTFTVNRFLGLGLLLLALGLATGLRATQESEHDRAFALMRAGASELLQALLTAFPSIRVTSWGKRILR